MNSIVSPFRLNEAIAQRSPVLVANMDSGIIVWASRRIHEIFNYHCSNELEGMSVEELIPEHLRDIHVIHRQSFSQLPSPMIMGKGRELLGRRRDGTTFPVEIELDSEKIGDERLAFLVIIDRSERPSRKRLTSHEPPSSS